MSLTGANADEWLAAKPGTEGVVALGLAQVILANKLRPADTAGRAAALVDGWSGGLAEYTPERVKQTLLEMGIEVCFLSMYGHFRGRLSPPLAKNAALRRTQHRAHADPQR